MVFVLGFSFIIVRVLVCFVRGFWLVFFIVKFGFFLSWFFLGVLLLWEFIGIRLCLGGGRGCGLKLKNFIVVFVVVTIVGWSLFVFLGFI